MPCNNINNSLFSISSHYRFSSVSSMHVFFCAFLVICYLLHFFCGVKSHPAEYQCMQAQASNTIEFYWHHIFSFLPIIVYPSLAFIVAVSKWMACACFCHLLHIQCRLLSHSMKHYYGGGDDAWHVNQPNGMLVLPNNKYCIIT